MRKRTQIIVSATMVIGLLVTTAFAEAATTTGTISKVTVYRGQALVTRTINVELPSGTSELIVEGLPAKIVPESLFAQTPGDLRVLSVRYRERAVEADTRKEVKELDAQISEVENQLFHTERKKQHLDHQWSMFIKLRDFTVAAMKTDLNRGLLTFEPINDLAKLIQQQGQEYIEQTLAFHDEVSELKTKLELLNRKRKKLDAGRSRTEREAILFVSNSKKIRAAIELSYLVDGANWLPQYNLRANPDKSQALVEYNAVVNQTSGEDWRGVSLSLSTAQPTMVAAPPALEPMSITLRHRVDSKKLVPKAERSQEQMSMVAGIAGFMDRSEDFKRLARSRREQAKKGAAAQKELGQIAMSNQMLEFVADRKDLVQMKQQAAEIARTEGVSVTYDLPGMLTLPSRTDQQLATIATISTDADFTLVASPLLTDYVYLQAELLNSSNTVLLPGRASMFRNGEFVGKSNLPIVTIGEKFTAGFGIDSQIQVARELEDKKTRIQGGNRIDTYHYRIALNNYKNATAKLRLLDRLPYTDEDSIKIELVKTEPELSKDTEYLRSARKKGILRWDLDLPPNSVNQDATIVRYRFTTEYDKNMQIQPRRSGR